MVHVYYHEQIANAKKIPVYAIPVSK